MCVRVCTCYRTYRAYRTSRTISVTRLHWCLFLQWLLVRALCRYCSVQLPCRWRVRQTDRQRGKYRERERLRLNIQYLLASFIYCSRLFIIIISILYCIPLSLSLSCIRCFIINFILLFSALCAPLVACELKAPLAK